MGMIGNTLAQGLISGANIQDGTVDTPDLKDSAVTAAKIATGVVTPAKLSTGAPAWDSAGNLGLGVTPESWQSGFRAIRLSGLASWNVDGSAAGSAVYFGNNVYRDASDSRWEYIATGDNATQYLQVAGEHRWRTSASGTAGNAITFTDVMRLDANGNLCLGSTSTRASYKLDIRNDNGIAIGGNATYYGTIGYSAGAGLMSIAAESGGGINFLAGATERARIDSSGYFIVGKTTTGVSTQGAVIGGASDLGFCSFSSSATNNSSITLQVYSTGAAANRFYVGYGGTVFATSTTISAISDIRFKENVRDLDAGLAEVMALQPRLYDWKEGKGADIKNARGFIAQEFEQVFPDLIDEWKDPAPEGEEPYKSVRADLIPVLVKAIQEQQAMIASQSETITSLTERITALEGA